MHIHNLFHVIVIIMYSNGSDLVQCNCFSSTKNLKHTHTSVYKLPACVGIVLTNQTLYKINFFEFFKCGVSPKWFLLALQKVFWFSQQYYDSQMKNLLFLCMLFTYKTTTRWFIVLSLSYTFLRWRTIKKVKILNDCLISVNVW